MIYLASQSPRRKKLLKDAGFKFRVVRSAYEEKSISGASPRRVAQLHAVGKAKGAAAVKNGVIIGCDTLIGFEGKVYGKPRSRAEAGKFLRKFSGRTHEVISGVALRFCPQEKIKSFIEVSKVKFKKLSDAEIERYLDTGEYADKSGAYACQGKGKVLIEKIVGSVTNVVGLPMERLKAVIASEAKQSSRER